MALYRINQVLNYGGFFGGDTISAVVEPFGGGEENDFTIDQHALSNVADRYKILDGFVLDIAHDGPSVQSARVVAAPSRAQLKEAIALNGADGPAQPLRIRAYKCTRSPYGALWVHGAPEPLGDGRYRCKLCGEEFQS